MRKTFAGKIRRHQDTNQPMTAPFHVIVGLTHLTEGKMALASKSFTAALRIDPRDATAHTLLGLTCLPDDAVQAIACFGRALEIRPKHAIANCVLGEIYYGKKLFPRAIEHFGQVLSVLPDNSAVELLVGQAFLMRGFQAAKTEEFYAAAKQHLERALSLEPNSTEAKLALAKYFYLNENKAECLRCLREVLAVDIAHKGALKLMVLVDHGLCEGYLSAAGRGIDRTDAEHIRRLPLQDPERRFKEAVFELDLDRVAPNGLCGSNVWRDLPLRIPVDGIAARAVKPNGND